jgi:hypothetical protein
MRSSIWVLVLAAGCVPNCNAQDPCPGHATEELEWALSNCRCPLTEEVVSHEAQGKACDWEGITCVADYTEKCVCKMGHWQCLPPDLAVPVERDLSVRDLSEAD